MPTTLADLARHWVIGYSYAPQRRYLDDGCAGWTLQRTGPSPKFHSNNGETSRAAALDHQGIVLQPDFLISSDLAAGRLLRILPELEGEELGIYAVYPTRKHLSGKGASLGRFLATAFAQPAWRQRTAECCVGEEEAVYQVTSSA